MYVNNKLGLIVLSEHDTTTILRIPVTNQVCLSKLSTYQSMILSHRIRQGCQVWPQIGPDWHRIGQIWDFLRSVLQYYCKY